MLAKNGNFVKLQNFIIIALSLYLILNLQCSRASPEGEYPDPDPDPEYGSPISCDRFQEISKIKKPGLNLVTVIHPSNQPTIAAIKNKQPNPTALFFTFNTKNNQYDESLIVKRALMNGAFVDFAGIKRKDDFFFGVSTISVNGLPVIGNAEEQPPEEETDFVLTGVESVNKTSTGAILLLDETENDFINRQILFGDNFGNVIAFALTTASGSIQNCFLFSILDIYNFRASIFCFHPIDFPNDDDVLHFLQEFPIQVSPLLTSIELGTKTLVLITNKANNYDDVYNYDNSTYTTTSTDYGNVVDVWAHEQGDDPLFPEDEIIFETNIITIDSILTKDNVALLAVGTVASSEGGADSISIYSYDEENKKFVLKQLLGVEYLKQVRFQRILETDEILFFTLTNDSEDNIHIYTVDSDYSLVESCSLTAEGAFQLEPISFFFKGKYGAQVIAVTPKGATVFET